MFLFIIPGIVNISFFIDFVSVPIVIFLKFFNGAVNIYY